MYWFTSQQYKAKLFCSESGVPYILPCIFSHSLTAKRSIWELKYLSEGTRRIKQAELVESSVSSNTIEEILSELKNFLLWVEHYSVEKETIAVATHYNFPVELLNYFLNNVLIRERNKSEEMAKKSLNALRAYYNYLAYHGFTNRKDLAITNDSLSIARQNTNHRGVVKYLSPGLRAQLYANARTLRDECILRAGGSCGIRSKENIGFLLNDFVVGNKKYKGLKALFREMTDNPTLEKFEYFLQGKYSKSRRHSGGKSRMLYIPRETLLRFQCYFEYERPDVAINNLFVTEPSSSYTKVISESRVTKAFSYAREQVLKKQQEGLLPDYMDRLEEKHSYHILRHSFGTDTFYDAAKESGLRVDDVSPTSQPYLLTAALLGHEASGMGAPQTTKDYIRSCHLKFELGH